LKNPFRKSEYTPDRPLEITIFLEEAVAIAGAGGAGKRTPVHLFPRFFDVTSGTIRIDGRDLRDCSFKSKGIAESKGARNDDCNGASAFHDSPRGSDHRPF
jgi:ABC-type antimicrobial peptide transport system ATPase subunit